MDKQIIEIANEDLSLSLFRGFLQVENKKNSNKTQISLDNILSIIISANDAIISKNIISAICENGGSLIICGRNYLPSSITVPYIGHWLMSSRIKKSDQLQSPAKKEFMEIYYSAQNYQSSTDSKPLFPKSSGCCKIK